MNMDLSSQFPTLVAIDFTREEVGARGGSMRHRREVDRGAKHEGTCTSY